MPNRTYEVEVLDQRLDPKSETVSASAFKVDEHWVVFYDAKSGAIGSGYQVAAYPTSRVRSIKVKLSDSA